MTTETTRWRRAGAPVPLQVDQIPRSPIRMPAAVVREGSSLFNQQFWLWGRDIRRPEGNALLEYGFAKHSPPAGLRVPSRYELPLPGDIRLTLWGFGLFIGDAGQDGLFLRRMKLAPRLMPSPGAIWEPGALPDVSELSMRGEWERVHTLLVPALLWIAEYECWVMSRYGADYRQECLDAWPRSIGRSDETARRWRRFADIASRSLRRALDPALAGDQALSVPRV